MSAQLPNMATKKDVALLKADLAQLPFMATKADVALLRADIGANTDVSDPAGFEPLARRFDSRRCAPGARRLT